MRPIDLIVIGASAGGVSAVGVILQGLPPSFSIPIAIVLHLPSHSQVRPALTFGRHTANDLVEAEDKMRIESRKIYFAPPGYHILIERDRSIALNLDEPVHFSRPSIDVLFESASEAYGSSLAGVLLTGANEDGARGLAMIQKNGGFTIVQDPKTAEMGTMPREALRLMSPNHILSLPEVPLQLASLMKGRLE